jgi:hypothetical protein
MLGAETAVPALKRRRSLSQVYKAVKRECFTAVPAKLKLNLRLNPPSLGLFREKEIR